MKQRRRNRVEKRLAARQKAANIGINDRRKHTHRLPGSQNPHKG